MKQQLIDSQTCFWNASIQKNEKEVSEWKQAIEDIVMDSRERTIKEDAKLVKELGDTVE